jgi:Flp pilus assembly pilin Flp
LKTRPATAPMIELALIFAMISVASFIAFITLG